MQPEIVIDERLMEMGLGEWQGKLMADIRRNYEVAFNDYFHRPEKFEMTGAESYYDVKDRVDLFIRELVREHYHTGMRKKVLVITHGVTLMMMRLLFNGGDVVDLASYGVADNAKLHIYQYDGSKFYSLIAESENFDAR
jgi:probable phosphoglycerate mutase